MSVIQRELPIKVTFSSDVRRPKKFNQHIKRVTIEGPKDAVPEELVLEADEIASGGVLMIDDMMLPPNCDVVDRRGNDPIVTVERQKSDKRSGQRQKGQYDD